MSCRRIESMFHIPQPIEQPVNGEELAISNVVIRQTEVSMNRSEPHLRLIFQNTLSDKTSIFLNQCGAEILAEYFARLAKSLSSEQVKS